MPTVYLSPSTQEYNPYYGGVGNEEYYMNLIVDAMIPYLDASGIAWKRNSTSDTALTSAQASNAAGVDLHVALHSNAAPEELAGQLQGPDVYYYASSEEGRRAAEIFANNLKLVYPYPDKVDIRPTTSLAELRRTIAPSVLIELAYHDNRDDANWIRNNIRDIARNLVVSIADFFAVPFEEP
ncbi:MAG: N-acetylmuramoyl-L-alanine amidase [Butyricicoccus sp.]